MNPNPRIAIFLTMLCGSLLWGGDCDRWVWRNPMPQGNTIHSVMHDGIHYWAVGGRGLIMNSEDGHSWDVIHSGLEWDFFDIVFTPYGFMVVGDGGVFVTSSDGEIWSAPQWTDVDMKAVDYNGGVFVAVGEYNKTCTNIGLTSWQVNSVDLSCRLNDIVYDQVTSQFLAVGSKCTLARSTWGLHDDWVFESILPGSTIELMDIEHIGDLYVAVGAQGAIFTSSDLTNWFDVSVPVSFPWQDSFFWAENTFVLGSNLYSSESASAFSEQYNFGAPMLEAVIEDHLVVATGEGGRIFSSLDGASWTRETGIFHGEIEGIAYGAGRFVVVCSNDNIYSSADGIHWDQVSGPRGFNGLAFVNDRFVAVGSFGMVYTSADAVNWNAEDSGTTSTLHDVAHSGNRCVAVGRDGVIIYSDDLQTWNVATRPLDTRHLYAVDHAAVTPTIGVFTAVGSSGEVVTSSTGSSWTRSSGAGLTTQTLRDVMMTGISGVAVGSNGVLLRKNFTGWSVGDSTVNSIMQHVTYDGTQYSAFAPGLIITSSDGINWTPNQAIFDGSVLNSLRHHGRTFLVGSGGMIVEKETPAQLVFDWPQVDIRVLITRVDEMCH